MLTTPIETKENEQPKILYPHRTFEQLKSMSDSYESCIVASIQDFFKQFPKVNPEQHLVNSIYVILKDIYVNNEKTIILRAPTGTGKTIIGFMLHYCSAYVENVYQQDDTWLNNLVNTSPFKMSKHSYMLTSSKMLQNQIEKDLPYFGMESDIFMLQGVKNYACFDNKPPENDLSYDKSVYATYDQRTCKGLSTEILHQNFANCIGICPYKNAREIASFADGTVLNYAYFLTVINSKAFIKFFEPRRLTIVDEGHLMPEIVVNQFNLELTRYNVTRVINLLEKVKFNFEQTMKNFIPERINIFHSLAELFYSYKPSIDDVIEFYDEFVTQTKQVFSDIEKLDGFKEIKSVYETMFDKSIKDILESVVERADTQLDILNELANRFSLDGLIMSEEVSRETAIVGGKHQSVTVYKHFIYDLSEINMVRNYFMQNSDVTIHMSATIHVDEHAKRIGIEKYKGYSIPSNFDFSNSPIFLTNSGWLNQSNFEKNIDDVISDAIKICTKLHPNHKGIIHTSTFKISDMLKQRLSRMPIEISRRFRFYTTPEEKEAIVSSMRDKRNTEPIIICGPSLYEGLDLKEDAGRFNIMIKVPWASLNEYVRRKMERDVNWYKLSTMEKIEQAIGRTNRSKTDWSHTYLLDSGFGKLVYELEPYIVKRILNKKL